MAAEPNASTVKRVVGVANISNERYRVLVWTIVSGWCRPCRRTSASASASTSTGSTGSVGSGSIAVTECNHGSSFLTNMLECCGGIALASQEVHMQPKRLLVYQLMLGAGFGQEHVCKLQNPACGVKKGCQLPRCDTTALGGANTTRTCLGLAQSCVAPVEPC